MLTREQQRLLLHFDLSITAEAMLGRLRETLLGGRTGPEPGQHIDYNRRGARLTDGIGGKVLTEVTWGQVQRHAATFPRPRLEELARARREDQAEYMRHYEATSAGFPRRASYDDEEMFAAASEAWDREFERYVATSSATRRALKAAIEALLPLAVDDEPVDLLELLASTPAATGTARRAGLVPPAAGAAVVDVESQRPDTSAIRP